MHVNQVNVEANTIIQWASIRTANEHKLELVHEHVLTMVKTSVSCRGNDLSFEDKL